MTTPFTAQSVTYDGIDPGGLPRPQYGSRRLWLGVPGNMIELPSRGANYSANPAGGEVQQNLYGGAVGVTRFANIGRTWSLEFPWLGGRDWQVVNGFYRRLFGAGPWAWVPPEDVNRLRLSTSMCGGLNSDISGWAATAGTLTADTSTSPVPPCGVLKWSGAGSGSRLIAGTVTSGAVTVDPTIAAPYIPAESVTVCARVKTATSTASVTLAVAGFDAAGALVTLTTGSTVTVNTAGWSLIAATLAAGALTSVYQALVFQCNTAAAPDLLLSTPSLSYTSYPPDWEAGAGVPRVVWPTSPGRALGLVLQSSATMTLAESTLGAA